MGVTSRYRESWEGFWSEAPQEPGEVLWDADPDVTAGQHLPLLEPHLRDAELPFVDLGCGNGTQTRFIATRFRKVFGADLSLAAIERAHAHNTLDGPEFRVLDCVDEDEVAQFAATLGGEANVYMRGVLHQCEPGDRQLVMDGVARLIGENGRAMLVELAEDARSVLMGQAQGPSGPPPKLAPVLRHGIAPGEMADAELSAHVAEAGLSLLASGRMPLITTEHTAHGSLIEVPSNWLVVGRSV
ncbi:class I SAM-dependent methyltransferase [Streptomyces sp. NA04227]|uniref:class I SAM-dependent methyltransferase n=1 Tax=Streptomyces sp. NA04227 TaxID=2742136 RepID=UPI0015916A17|nr:class I SAM-dependent methyltransferase [Streptomyces sp. NA04227]QKW10150.1 class I SAM-dependent methyltransferase [Streptomyces sp. NA04227]